MKNISLTTKKFAVLALLAIGFAAGAVQGCGGSSGSAQATCIKGCDKFAMCFGVPADTCKSSCKEQGANGNGQMCANESAIISKYNECLAKSCDELSSCVLTIPACETSGAGGTSGGTGGSTGGGAGGTSGSADCATCVKADACCVAAIGAANCTTSFGTQCATLPAADRPTVVMACAALLTSFPNVAACQ